MALVYSNTIKSARLQVVADAMDGGQINIYTSGYGELLVSIPLDDPSASVVDDTLTISSVPLSGIGIADGVGAIAEIMNEGSEVIANGITVGESAANLILDNVNVGAGQTVTLTAGQIVHG